jgi:hypothetical protein
MSHHAILKAIGKISLVIGRVVFDDQIKDAKQKLRRAFSDPAGSLNIMLESKLIKRPESEPIETHETGPIESVKQLKKFKDNYDDIFRKESIPTDEKGH